MENQEGVPACRKLRLASVFTTLLLLLAVVICLFVVVQSLSKGYVNIGGVSVFRVVTGSMEPTIPVGALLLSQSEDIDQVQEGDIVCFRSKEAGMLGSVITHRVVGVYAAPDGQPLLQTQGDANLSADIHYVTADNLIGRVVWYTGDGSTMAAIFTFLTSEFGFLACIVLPVMLVSMWILRDAARSIKKEIAAVEKRLEETQEDTEKDEDPATLSEEEYAALYQQIANEVRKELEQDAAEIVEHSDVAEPEAAESAEDAVSAEPVEESAAAPTDENDR